MYVPHVWHGCSHCCCCLNPRMAFSKCWSLTSKPCKKIVVKSVKCNSVTHIIKWTSGRRKFPKFKFKHPSHIFGTLLSFHEAKSTKLSTTCILTNCSKIDGKAAKFKPKFLLNFHFLHLFHSVKHNPNYFFHLHHSGWTTS